MFQTINSSLDRYDSLILPRRQYEHVRNLLQSALELCHGIAPVDVELAKEALPTLSH
jgi:hypothetical protein